MGVSSSLSPERTRLVERIDDPERLTPRRDTDVRTALTRGLAEYLADCSDVGPDGEDVRFAEVFESHAVPEDGAVYPAACVMAQGDGDFDSGLGGGQVSSKSVAEPDGRFYTTPAEFSIELQVSVYATTPEERCRMCALFEDALSPVPWRNGALLELPHYYGQRASYVLLRGSYDDDDDDARQGSFRAVYALRATVAQTRLFRLPGKARIQTRLEVR